MKLQIIGTYGFDPFGIKMLKHDGNINQTYDIGDTINSQRFGLFNGMLTIGAAVDVTPTEVDVDVKIAIMGLTIFNAKEPVNTHVANGVIPINVGGPQLGFNGTVQIILDATDTAALGS